MRDPNEPGADEPPSADTDLRTKRVSRRREGQDLLRDIAILQIPLGDWETLEEEIAAAHGSLS